MNKLNNSVEFVAKDVNSLVDYLKNSGVYDITNATVNQLVENMNVYNQFDEMVQVAESIGNVEIKNEDDILLYIVARPALINAIKRYRFGPATYKVTNKISRDEYKVPVISVEDVKWRYPNDKDPIVRN